MAQATEKKEFEIKVTQAAGLGVAGLKIRTSMATAMVDCPKLWQETFVPRMGEIPGGNGTAYGISEVVDCHVGIFDYWAAAPISKDAQAPAGMEILDLPDGLYAQCRVDGLEHIAAAYNFIYSTWLPGQTEFDLNYTARCYEYYPADSLETGVFYIYVQVDKK